MTNVADSNAPSAEPQGQLAAVVILSLRCGSGAKSTSKARDGSVRPARAPRGAEAQFSFFWLLSAPFGFAQGMLKDGTSWPSRSFRGMGSLRACKVNSRFLTWPSARFGMTMCLFREALRGA
jgi:hypothetical protein